jgi:hypothetical protein
LIFFSFLRFEPTGQAKDIEVIPAPVSSLTLDDCLLSPTCWGMTKHAFVISFKLHLREMDGSEPGRFFDNTLVFALDKMDEDLHFTKISCIQSPSKTTPCPQFRDVLENRIVPMCLLESLPIEAPHDQLFNPRTWEIKALGKDYLQKVKKRRPHVWSEIAVLVSKSLQAGDPQNP